MKRLSRMSMSKKKEDVKPITEQLEKEIDEISKLREEAKEMQIVPYSEQVKRLALPGPDGKQMKMVSNMDKGFTPEDLEIIQKYQLPLPSKVLVDTMKDEDVASKLLNKAGELNKKLGGEKGNLSTTKKARKNNKDLIDGYSEEIKTIKKYRSRISIVEEGTKTLKVGEGIYTQTKRNAYKIDQKGTYGNLIIDMPKLYGQLKLIAYKDGEKVYDKQADFDTLDLLTKRFNTKKNYSPLSKSIFNDLNRISEIPIHRTSNKYKKIGSGVVYYNNPQDLFSRLELLGGSIMAGNDGVKDEFTEIVHTLNKLGILNNNQLNNLLKEYVIK